MKRWTMVILGAALVLTISGSPSRSEDEPNTDLKDFMRVKLIHSQKVVEGLTLENYDMIAKSAQQMSLLSQASNWQVLQTPQYLEHSAEFRRAADSLRDAAMEKSLDGAALAYVEVTLKCVKCHKYVRSVKTAGLQTPSDELYVQLSR